MSKYVTELNNDLFSRDVVIGLKSEKEMHNDKEINKKLKDDQFKEIITLITPEKKTKPKKSSIKLKILRK